ncbi:hypothetical protein [Gelidibacter japonicus]|jgi:hypothetical protein|uniref:hypothetical protein n=1 Tax=Gelidibacter japonicus TaxID=1962232 RepID=UPI002AFE7942|nr:hypothetical protein [Gelidibacter japonicus]
MYLRQIIFNKFLCLSLALISVTMILSCQPEEFSNGNSLVDDNIDASFTITPIDGAINRYNLVANSTAFIASKWDVGDGPFMGNSTQEVFFPDAGTYVITHIAIGPGGVAYTSSQNLVVEESDPVAGNLIKGGKFLDAADHAEWTILPLSASGAQWTLNPGSATITAGGWSQQGIYQAVEVVANKDYAIDMLVSGDACTETWFEVFAGTTPPVPGQEYNDNKVMGLSTWDGCATSKFSGRLSKVGCVKNSQTDSVTNIVNFSTSGTIYLVVRCGGNVLPAGGITMTNVELRGIN